MLCTLSYGRRPIRGFAGAGRYAADVESLTNAMIALGRLRWRDGDPSGLARQLRRDGFRVHGPNDDGAFELCLGRLPVLLEASSGAAGEGLWLDAGAGDLAQAAAEDRQPRQAHPNGVTGVVAIGLATVDAERAMRESRPIKWQPAGDDALLGARAWSVRAGDTQLLLLEPATEGRVAAALARMGEGPVALYLYRDGDAARRPADTAEPRRWPLGTAARLISPRRPWGPFLLLVEPERHATNAPREGALPVDAGRPLEAAS